jgi:hypothetical protein
MLNPLATYDFQTLRPYPGRTITLFKKFIRYWMKLPPVSAFRQIYKMKVCLSSRPS